MSQTISTTRETATFAISGMSCGGCVSRVRDALAGVAGIERADVSVGAATITMSSSERKRTVGAAMDAIQRAGYAAIQHAVATQPSLAPSTCCSPRAPQQIASA